MWIDIAFFSKLIKGGFESGRHIRCSFLQCMQHRHENLASSGARFGLRAEADLLGNNQRTELSFGQIVIRRHTTVICPVI
jgi:hypothetical protein